MTSRATLPAPSPAWQILDRMGIAVLGFGKDFRIHYVSPAATRLSGIRASEFIGHPVERHLRGPALRRMLLRRCRGAARSAPLRASVRSRNRGNVPINLFAARAGSSIFCALEDQRERERARIEYSLLRSVIFALGRAEDLRSALASVLRSVCDATGWALGEAWLPDALGLRLAPGPIWARPGRRLAAFVRASRRYTFGPGEGLPGRVWRSRMPVWVRDVRVDYNFPRARLAARAGLQGAFAVPVLGAGQVIAVLGFYVFEPRQEDDRLVRLVSAVAAELGLVIQKTRAERALRLSWAGLQARDQERRRVARELHDGVNQTLSSVAFRLKVLEADLGSQAPGLRQQASRAHALLQDAVKEVRRITRDLGPLLVEDRGLVRSIRQLGRDMSLRSGVSFRLMRRRFPSRLPPGVASHLYRIVQEALANVEKHADASRVSVRLWRRASRIGVSVNDNGKGFRLSRETAAASGRLGLANIRERVRLARGTLQLRTRPGRGTRIHLELPLSAADRTEGSCV